MNTDTASPIVTPKELARELKTTIPTVLSWYHKGWIPAVAAVGRIYRFDLDAVKAALAAKTSNQTAR